MARHQGGRRDEGTRVFAQPLWLRGMNLVVAAVIAVGVVGVVSAEDVPSTPVLDVAGWLLAGALVWVGVRAARAHVVVTDDKVRYRGALRTYEVPLDQVLGLRTARPLPGSDAPCLVWRKPDGSTTEFVLWCFWTDRHSVIEFGRVETDAVVRDLRNELASRLA